MFGDFLPALLIPLNVSSYGVLLLPLQKYLSRLPVGTMGFLNKRSYGLILLKVLENECSTLCLLAELD